MKGEIEGKKGPFDALKMLRRIKNLPSGMAQEGSKTDQSSDEDLHLSNRHSVGKGRQSSKGRGMDGPGSHCPPLSGRDDREAKANWQKRSGRENMGQRAKAACICLLPWTKGWRKMISAGCRERLRKNYGLSMEGDENERAYEIVCTADESG